jgi:demethylmenaquinone methyltransferase/2-methoxy-6-polyprenyl-1,4-benzoquinol methylase
MRVSEDTLARTKAPRDIRGMFHEISPTYDFLNHLLSLNTDRRWRRFVAEKTLTRETRAILDVCSGTGDLALAYSRRARRMGTEPLVVGSDFTPAMVGIARRKFCGVPAHAPHASVSDTLHLPFPDACFDLVSVAFGIRNVADTRSGLLEMRRVCRPGGRIAVLEFSQPRNAVLRWLYSAYFFTVLPWIGRLISGSRAYTYLPKSVAGFPDRAAFSALLTEVAGCAAEASPLSCGIATLYVAEVAQ